MNKGERIAFAIDHSGMTPAAMARRIGCTPAAIYQWIKGETKDVKNEFLFALSDETGFHARWLATGDGPQRKADDEQSDRLTALFSKLDSRGRVAVLRVAEAEAEYAIKPTPSKD